MSVDNRDIMRNDLIKKDRHYPELTVIFSSWKIN